MIDLIKNDIDSLINRIGFDVDSIENMPLSLPEKIAITWILFKEFYSVNIIAEVLCTNIRNVKYYIAKIPVLDEEIKNNVKGKFQDTIKILQLGGFIYD